VWAGQEACYLVLDEPTTSLDLKHQHAVLSLVLTRVRAGLGAVVVLHDLGLAAQYATKLVLLAGGRVSACGSAAEVLSAERLRADFGVQGALQSVGGVPVVAVRGEGP
jgi:iron complex transport system ATP-binding protein